MNGDVKAYEDVFLICTNPIEAVVGNFYHIPLKDKSKIEDETKEEILE